MRIPRKYNSYVKFCNHSTKTKGVREHRCKGSVCKYFRFCNFARIKFPELNQCSRYIDKLSFVKLKLIAKIEL